MVRRTLAALASSAVLGATLVPVVGTPAAHAAGEDLATCMANQGVWVIVKDGKSGCAMNPANGTAALEAIGVKITWDAKTKMICALDGAHAESCGAPFTGSYWNYSTGKPGSAFVYSQKGPNDSKPVAGTVEGWAWGETNAAPQMPAAPTVTTSATPTEPTSATAEPTATATPTAAAESQHTSHDVPWIGLTLAGLAAVATLGLMGALTTGTRNKLDESR